MKINRKAFCWALAACFIVFSPALSLQAEVAVTASSVHGPQYVPEHAGDGNSETRWASRVTDRTEWLQFDFGESVAFEKMILHWETAHAVEYEMQVSEDARDWKRIHRKSDCKGGKEQITGLKAQGRYLRIVFLKYARWRLASIWEVEFPGSKAAEILKAHEKNKVRRVAEKSRKVAERLAEFGVSEIVFAAREDGVDGHWYGNFGYYAQNDRSKLYRAQGRLCKLDLETRKVVYLVDDPEGSVRDPAVHYDAEKILFSWRKSGTETFHLYEINVDGTGLKQLTDGIYDDLEPTYLPDGGIMFVSARGKRWVNCWASPVAILYRCDGDGKSIRQISANIEHDNTPWVLPDGRVLYQRWEYTDRSQVHFHHLWTANPDGTGQMVFFGNMHPGSVYIDAKPIPGSDRVVLIDSPGHGRREHAGHVATVTDKSGPDERSSLRRISKRGSCRDPYPLSEDAFIVADGKKIVLMDSKGSTAEIYSLSGELARANIHEPRPILKRKRERVIPSRINLGKATGELVLTDVYNGRNMQGVKRGDIKKLLVVESLPKPINFTGGMDPLSYGGTFTLERILGTVPVEPDGSAYMQLPANRALFFVALDENNNSVKRMQSFLTVMPGEVTSCVGCHEQRGKAPMSYAGHGRLQAVKTPPRTPELPKGIPDVFDYPRDIQPILDRHCVKCHDYDDRQGKIILTGDRGPMFSHSYVTLTLRKQFVDGRNDPKSNLPPRAVGSSASPIMKMLSGAHYKAKLSQHEQDMIRYWIETGAAYPGTYAALGGGSIGGYQRNRQTNQDKALPTAAAFRNVADRRCIKCHKKRLKLPLPRSLSDEIGLSFWRPRWNDKRFRFSRHLMFNLTRPEKSLYLLAPLASEAGGYGICRGNAQQESGPADQPVFADTSDADYRALLKHIAAGKTYLEQTITRFDMAQFRPTPQYLREMKRYGVLPASFDPAKETIDVYDLDRRYWESMWHKPGTK